MLPQTLGFPRGRRAVKTGSTVRKGVRTWALPQRSVPARAALPSIALICQVVGSSGGEGCPGRILHEKKGPRTTMLSYEGRRSNAVQILVQTYWALDQAASRSSVHTA